APEASAEEEERLAGLRARLLAERGRRIRPGLDDKVLADWNGLMIAALVNAATALGEPAWVDMAARAFAFIARAMTRGDRLGHAWRAGKLTFPGFASDYAAMIGAALALHEASGARPYLDQAIAWARALDRHHLDPASGLLFQSADDASDLPTRLAPTADEAVPNAHGVFAAALVRLAAHTGDEAWRRRADALIAAVAKSMGSFPLAHGAVLNAFDFRLRAAEIVVAGDERQALRHAALAIPFLDRVVVDLADPQGLPPDHPAAAQLRLAGSGAAFVCVGERCSLPVRDPGEITRRIEEMRE
ncbi:MAG: thioredoxin domain-containing protein, partial [Methylobacteriaceae bacterium]|nr:thioredoxin domain-containing protein [Methylobacteriaceae bacterium]